MAVRLRGALLGAGNIGLRGHAPQWLRPEIARQAEIVAVADVSAANREAAGRLFPAAVLYQSATQLLAVERLDFADVCTPPFTRLELVEGAAARGVHLLCEKPIALGLADAERIASLVRDAGVVFKPCHQYHHSPLWMTVRELSARIGRIRHARYEVRRLGANEGNANWRPEWRTSAALAGGGILVDHGAHVFYQLRAVMGEARRVQATVRTLEHKTYGVEDTACILLECGDAIAEVTLSWAAHRRETSFRLIGERGEIAGDENEVRLFVDGEQTVLHPGGLSGDSSHSDWYLPLFSDFLRQVRDRAPAAEELEEAVYVARVIECAYTASQAERALAVASTEVLADELEAGAEELAMTAAPEPGAEPPRTEPDPRRARQAVGRGVALVALVAAVTWMLHDVAWGGVWRVVTAAQPGWIAVAAGVNLVVLVFQAARWLALVRPLAPAATLGSAFRAMITGFTVSAFVPARGGELARVEMLGRETGLPRMVVMGSVLLDTLVNASVLLIGSAVLPFFVTVPLWMRPGGWAALCLFGLGVAAVLALRATGSPAAASAEASRLPLRRGLSALATQVRRGLGATTDARALALSFSASLGAWILETNVAALSLRAVGLRLPLGSTILVLLAVNFALALPVATPANVGTLEIGATLALVELGVPKETAIAFAVSYHLLQLVPIATIGLVIALRGWLRGRSLGH
jgi:uncharacterized protein (TIRG00374 family)